MNKFVIITLLLSLIVVCSVNAYEYYLPIGDEFSVVHTGSAYLGFLYSNYSVDFLVDNATWQVKHGNLSTYNITFTNNHECWGDKLQLRIGTHPYSSDSPSFSFFESYPECYNGIEWVEIGNRSTPPSISGIGQGVTAPTNLYDNNYSTQAFPSASDFKVCLSGDCVYIQIYEQGMYFNTPILYNMSDYVNNGTILIDYHNRYNGTPINFNINNGQMIYTPNHGTLNGGVSIGEDGAELNGINQYISLTPFTLNQNNGHTSCITFNQTTAGIQVLYGQETSTSAKDTSFMIFTLASGKLSYRQGNGSSYNTLAGTQTTYVNQSYRACITFNSTFKAGYINGIQDANTSLVYSPYFAGDSFNIGINGNEATEDFIGTQSNFKVWDRMLTSEEIYQEYLGNLNEPTLYKINLVSSECNATTCFDSHPVDEQSVSFNGVNENIAFNQQTGDLENGFATSFYAKVDSYTSGYAYILADKDNPTNNFIRIQTNGIIILEASINNVQCVSNDFGNGDYDWHHYAISVENYTCNFWYDGVEIGAVINNLASNFIYDNWGKGNNNYFNGTIKNPVIFNKTINNSIVQSLYNYKEVNEKLYSWGTGRQPQSVSYWFEQDGSLYIKDQHFMSNSTTTDGGVNLGDALEFGDGNPYVSVDSSVITTNETSICFWEYSDSTGDYTLGYFLSDNTDPLNLFMRRYTSGSVIGEIGEVSFNAISSSIAPLDTWNHHCLVHYSNGTALWYINGNNEQSIIGSNFQGLSSNLYLGNKQALDRDFYGSLDEVRIYDISLLESEVYDLYNFNDLDYSSLSLTENGWYTNNSAHNTYNLTFNVTMSEIIGYNPVCTLTRNGSVIQTMSGLVQGIPYIFYDDSFNSTTQATYYYQVNCSNGGDYVESSVVYLTIDNVNPVLNLWYEESKTGYYYQGSELVLYNQGGNLTHTMYVNAQDDYLYSVNITTSWGDTLYNLTPGSTEFTQNYYLNLTNAVTLSVNTVTVQACSGTIVAVNCTTDSFSFYKPNVSYSYTNVQLDRISYPYYYNVTFNNTWTDVSNFVSVIAYFNDSTSTYDNVTTVNYNVSGTLTTIYYQLDKYFVLSNSSVGQNYTGNVTSYNNNGFYPFFFDLGTIEVQPVVITNCSGVGIYRILNFYGYNEVNRSRVIPFDMNIEVSLNLATEEDLKYNFAFRNQANYTVCSSVNQTISVNSIIEYGNLQNTTIFSDRKYYIDNLNVTPGTPETVNLYHLNKSLTTEVVLRVYEKGSLTAVEGAKIRIFRFYPETGQYLEVESEKTDGNGYTLGKLVLADVFYQFYVEYPVGTVKLVDGPLKILALTRGFPIYLGEDTLGDWQEMSNSEMTVSCTNATGVCRMTWVGDTVKTGTLTVQRKVNGKTSIVSTQSLSASSANLVYTINQTEARINEYEYTVVGQLVSSSGNVLTMSDVLSYVQGLGVTFPDKQEFIIPVIMALIFMASLLIDFGAVGVMVGSTAVLAVAAFTKIVPLPVTALYAGGGVIGIIALMILILWKMKER